jgi:NAD(P)-dependent dehydrogenase (short-subunit alcohol dehydrogenase family)
VRALVYGASGGLARSLITALTRRDWSVAAVTRSDAAGHAEAHRVDGAYSGYQPQTAPDAVFLPQALFVRKPLVQMTDAEIAASLAVGLTDIIRTVRNLLATDTDANKRTDYVLIGSTSAYAGFANTAVYCVVKHGLVGLVRALNDEYAGTAKRFWLFSMGTMDTAMGRTLTDQDETSFLDPDAVAERIVTAITAQDNLFEPEVVIRRRAVRFKEASR